MLDFFYASGWSLRSNLNLVAFERLVAKGEIIQAEVKRVYLMSHHLNFGDKTGFSSDGSAVPNLGSERSANDCYERRVLDAVQFPNSAGRPILRYLNCAIGNRL
jgi:hypothetical protein